MAESRAGRRMRALARGIVALVLAPVVLSVVLFIIDTVREANAAPACVLNTHYTRTLTNGGLPIVYRFTQDCTWTVPSGATSGDIMVVGGGGGGGADGGSGGGGGEMRSGSTVTVGSSVDIDIGAGGVGGSWGSYGGIPSRVASAGSDTTLTWSGSVQYRAKGGNPGGGWSNTGPPGGTGGSGGTGGTSSTGGSGGTGPYSSCNYVAYGTNGSAGPTSSITGTSTNYAGGGGGGLGVTSNNGTNGYNGNVWALSGGLGGGGQGAWYSLSAQRAYNASSGDANTGSGGGAGVACDSQGYSGAGVDRSGTSGNDPRGFNGPGQRTMGGDGGSGIFIFKVGAAPTISTQPSSGSVQHGSTRTFSVTATTTYQETVSYQWQKAESTATSTWSNISGATSSSYTTGATVVTTDNGDLYRVVVTTTADGVTASTTSSSATLTVTKADQTISFTNPGTTTWSSTPLTLSATATSGLTVTISSSTTSVCTVSGFTLTMVASGTCTLTAAQAGDATYNAASSVSLSFAITGTGRTGITGNSSTISGTTDGTKYIVEQFTTTGSTTWTAPQGVTTIDYLVVGGGGGGGSWTGGGGGAGGVLSASAASVTQGANYTITVGSGGSGARQSGATNTPGTNGSSSSISGTGLSVTAYGGGVGASWSAQAANNGASNVGSGGGGGGNPVSGGAGTSGQGSNGGSGKSVQPHASGGGGGAGAVGGNGSQTDGTNTAAKGGNGGAGLSSSITGTATFYGGGGGAGVHGTGCTGGYGATAGSGGSGGGGAGAVMASGATSVTATSGVANSGGGGGGAGVCSSAGYTSQGGSGGSGIVVVRYALPAVSEPNLADASDNGSSSTDNLTSLNTLTLTGSAPVGAIVQLSTAAQGTSTSSGTWTNTGSTCTTNSTTGEWSCTTGTLSVGTYSIRASATTTLDGVTDTQVSATALSVNISGTATKLSVTTQPVGAGAGASLATQPIVKVLDANNLVVESSTASIVVSASSGTLGGTTTVAAVNGVATFTNLTFAGTTSTNYTLTFASTGLTSATSSNFTVTVGTATKLVLTTSASGATYGSAFTTQPVVEIQDAGSNKVTTATNVVSASLSAGTVVGTGNSTAVAGTATFVGLGITGTPGSYTVTYSAAGLTSTSQSITVAKANQTALTLSSTSGTFGSNLTLTTSGGSSGGAKTYVVSSGTATGCAESGGVLSVTGAGTCSVTVTMAGGANYNDVSSSATTVTFAKATQTVSFTSPGNQTYSASTIALTTSASSGLTPTITSSTTSVCTVSGTTLTLVSSGTCTLVSAQSGNSNYEAATSVTNSITVSKATPTVSSMSAQSKTYGDSSFTPTAPTVTFEASSVAGSIAYSSSNTSAASVNASTGAVTIAGAGSATITATFTPTDTGKFNTATTTYGVTVAKASQTVSFTSPGDQTYSASTISLTTSASSGLTPTITSSTTSVCTVSGTTLTLLTSGTCTLTSAQAGDANYNAATSVTNSITVSKANTSLTSFANLSKTYGDAAFSLTAPTASVAGSIGYASSNTSVATISGSTVTVVGAGSATITATLTPSDTGKYNTSTITSTLTVGQATPSLSSFANVAKTYGDAAFGLTAPTASVAGAFTYSSSNTAVVTISGSVATVVATGTSTITATFTPTDATNYASNTITMTATVAKATQTVSFTSPGNQTYSASTIALTTSASSGLTPTITSSTTSVCTVSGTTLTLVSSGTCTLVSAQSGNSNYEAATSVTNSITVSKATPTVSSMSAQSKTYGDAAFTPTAPTALFESSSVSGSVSYSSSNTSVATVGTSSGEVTVVGAGSATITATFAPTDTGKFNSSTTTYALSVAKAAQTVSFTSPGNKTYTGSAISLTASASSGLATVISSSTTSVCTVSGTSLTLLTSGTCSLDAAQAGNGNYEAATTVTQTITVSKATPTVSSMSAQSKTYGDVAFTPTAPTASFESSSVSGSVSYSSSNTSVATVGVSTGEVTVVGAGSATITAAFSPTDTGKFNATTTTYQVSVGQAIPALSSFANVSKSYGDAAFGLSAPTASVPGSFSYASSDVSVLSVTGSVATVVAPGTATITATFTPTDATNYATNTISMTATVNKAVQTLSFTSPGNQTYSGSTISLVASASSGLTPSISSSTTSVCTVSGTTLMMVAPGTCTLTAAQAGDTNYEAATSVTSSIEIAQRPITITATSATKEYGATDQAFSYSLSSGSLVVGDSLTGALSRASGENVGTYAMTLGTLANAKYAITFVPANLTITERPITVTAATKTKQYGDNDPAFTWSVTTGSLVGADTLSGSLTRVSGTDVGTYAIIRGTLANANYDITYVGAQLTITQRPITVTADTKTKQYGDSDPSLTWTVTTGSIVSGDSLSGSLTRVAGESVGTYVVSRGTLDNSNYAVTYVAANFTVTARPITVTATDRTKVYGESDPSLTWSVTTGSLVGSDNLSGSLTRASGDDVGSYAITRGTLANSNYAVTFVDGELTITQRPITVTADAKTKVYGDSDPTFTYSISSGSLVNSDTLSGSLSRASGTGVGTYATTIGTLANSNYAITLVPANLTITAKPITVTADDKTITYGDPEPSLTYSMPAGSLVGGDSLSGTLVRTAGTNAGTYTISRGTLTNSNYTITFVAGTLTINKASQAALTMSTTSVVYGTDTVVGSSGGSGDGAVTYAVTNAGTAGCSLAGSTLSTTGGVGSTCTVTATKAASTNYNAVSSSATTITVGSRLLTIAAVAATKQYGQSDPDFTYTITSGALVSGDTLSGSLDRASGENVGTYAIGQGTLTNSNYTITFVPANLTVTQRPITVTAANKTKVYGNSDPSLTYSITSGSLLSGDSLSGSISRATGNNVGTYAIGQGTLSNANYAITFVDATLSITGAGQSGFTVTSSSMSVTYGSSVTLSTTGGDGDGEVTYAAVDGTGSCTISGSTLTGAAAGTCEVTATKAAEGNYLEATSDTITITVTKADQTITFTDPADRNFATAPFALSPTSSSGLAVTIASSTTSVCTVADNTVTMVFSGTCTLTASRGASANYNAALDVTQSFEIAAVAPLAPTITQLTASDRAIAVLFTAGNSGGSALLNYEYSTDDGVTWTAWPTGSTTSPLNIAGLTNGVEYRVKIRAINAIGTGAESNMLAVTPIAPVVVAGPTTTTIDPSSTTSTIIETSTTTIFTTTTVTLAPNRRATTTTVARRAITTTTITQNGQSTTTVRATTTTTSTTTSLVDRIPAGLQRITTTTSGVIVRPSTVPTTNGVTVRPSTTTATAPSTTQRQASTTNAPATTGAPATTSGVIVRPQTATTDVPAQPSTTAAAPLTPLVPVLSTSTTTTTIAFDTIPARVAPAESASVIDGESTRVEILQVSAEQIRAEVGNSSLNVVTMNASGERQPLLPNGSLAYVPGTTTRIDGEGMLAGSKVEVWMHSTPTLLGVATASADGTFAQVFQVPSILEHGSHKLQVVGVAPNGAEMVVAIGITVTDEHTMSQVRAGDVTAEEADMLGVAGVTGAARMNEQTASKVLLLVIVLMLLLAATSTRRYTIRPRALSVQARIADWTPWLAQHGNSRYGVHALGALIGLGSLVNTDFHATAPSALWVAILVLFGIVDVTGGLVASLVWLAGLAATGNLGSMFDVRIAVLVAALGFLPIVTAELVRPGTGRSRSSVTASQLFVVAALTATMSASLLALMNAATGLSFAASAAMNEVAVTAIVGSVVRLALTARLAPDALRHARRCAPHFFGAVGVVIVVSLTPNTASVATIVGIAVFAAVVVAMSMQTRLGFAPRLVSIGSTVMVAVLVVAGGVVSFGSSSRGEVPLEVDAVEVDQMTIIGQTSAFVDGIPHVFVAGKVKEGEVVYANGALGMTLTISSHTVLGDAIPLGPNSEIQLVRGQKVGISGIGFAPDQDVNAWLFSDPVLVGNTSTNSVGLVKDSFNVPAVVHSGSHTLQVRLISADGKLVNFGIPVVVIDELPKDVA